MKRFSRLLAQSSVEPYFDVARDISPPSEKEQYGHKDHPPPLGQRERSTSAPNVSYNLVGPSTEITDEFLHRIGKGNYTTLHGNHFMAFSSELLFLFVMFCKVSFRN
jgi:hypothetical protein